MILLLNLVVEKSAITFGDLPDWWWKIMSLPTKLHSHVIIIDNVHVVPGGSFLILFFSMFTKCGSPWITGVFTNSETYMAGINKNPVLYLLSNYKHLHQMSRNLGTAGCQFRVFTPKFHRCLDTCVVDRHVNFRKDTIMLTTIPGTF